MDQATATVTHTVTVTYQVNTNKIKIARTLRCAVTIRLICINNGMQSPLKIIIHRKRNQLAKLPQQNQPQQNLRKRNNHLLFSKQL